MEKLNILAFAGSLRKNSYNKMLLNNMVSLGKDIFNINIFDISEIPLFNQDFENDPPEIIRKLRKQINDSVGVIIATPEYNFSFSAITKNIIDWLSRVEKPLDNKSVCICGASGGYFGTARAQIQLRPVLAALNTKTMSKPDLFIPNAQNVFADNGEIIDTTIQDNIKDFLQKFNNFIE